MKQKIFEFDSNDIAGSVYGPQNAHLHFIEDHFSCTLSASGNILKINALEDDIKVIYKLFNTLEKQAIDKPLLDLEDIKASIRFMDEAPEEIAVIKTGKRDIAPRTPRQAQLIKAVHENDLTFACGPAGTGKTYLAVALAVDLYLSGEVERMVFARPAVEAGERLGYLPGDMQEKIAPYLKPIYDALHDFLPSAKLERAHERGEIEIAPLAFMRGRTLNHAAIVLDEAQNTTPLQMKMFLTRFGEGSKMIIAGDPTQADLPHNTPSGLKDAIDIIESVKGSKFIHFTNQDVVRHDLVGRILDAYEDANN